MPDKKHAAPSEPGAKVSLSDIQHELGDQMARKMIPNYDPNHFADYVKLTPRKDDTCAYHLIVDYTGVNFAVSASDAGTLDALLDASKGLFELAAGTANPITIINATQTSLHGLKKAIKAQDPEDEQKIIFHVVPCCHMGPQPFTVTLNVTGTWLITDKGDDDEIVNLTGYLEANGEKDPIDFHAIGTDQGAGTPQLFGKSAEVSFETETDFLVVIYLKEDCHTDGILMPPWKDAVSAIKVTDIQIVIETSQKCEKKEPPNTAKLPGGKKKKQFLPKENGQK